jgi:hypothetical protein
VLPVPKVFAQATAKRGFQLQARGVHKLCGRADQVSNLRH